MSGRESQAKVRTDTERLDALEKIGFGLGVIHDDDGAWAVGTDGMQNIRMDPASDFTTSYFIEAAKFKPTIREAIDLFLDNQKTEEEAL